MAKYTFGVDEQTRTRKSGSTYKVVLVCIERDGVEVAVVKGSNFSQVVAGFTSDKTAPERMRLAAVECERLAPMSDTGGRVRKASY